eukprot:SAG31_NODE_7140_length_1779_cov_0.745238_2_plen_143_part_00
MQARSIGWGPQSCGDAYPRGVELGAYRCPGVTAVGDRISDTTSVPARQARSRMSEYASCFFSSANGGGSGIGREDCCCIWTGFCFLDPVNFEYRAVVSTLPSVNRRLRLSSIMSSGTGDPRREVSGWYGATRSDCQPRPLGL